MATPAKKESIAVVKKETVDIVAEKIRQFQVNGQIHFPANYSPENALKSAWLILQETLNRDKKPVLEICTRVSIMNSLLNMAIQGLNPGKNQGYFIAYGKALVFQRSYFGTMAVTKRVAEAKDIFAQVVYEGDEFEYSIKGSQKVVTKHVQKLENIDNTKIKAAYCTIELPDDRTFTDIVTIDQLKAAWKQSKMNPIDDKGNIKAGSTHEKFTADMATKTATNHACKYYLNSSDDNSLIMRAVHQSDEELEEAQLEEEIEESANKGEVIDVEFDRETGEILNGETVSASSTSAKEEVSEESIEEAQEKLIKGPGF